MKSSDSTTINLLLKNSSTFGKNFENLVPAGLVKNIGVFNSNENVEVRIKKKELKIATEYFDLDNGKELTLHLFEREDSPWLEREGEHFLVIYRDYHSHLVKK